MSRTTKIVGFSVPPLLVREVEQVAKAERRTKSELFREWFHLGEEAWQKIPYPPQNRHAVQEKTN